MNETLKVYDVASWIQMNLTLDPASSVTFKEVHSIYSQDVIKSQFIPHSKKVFSSELRNIYKQHILDNKVKLVNRGGILIKGIKMYERNNS